MNARTALGGWLIAAAACPLAMGCTSSSNSSSKSGATTHDAGAETNDARADSPADVSAEDARASDTGMDVPLDVPQEAGPLGGSRPVWAYVPSSYRPSVPTPLVIMLHGFGANGALEELYLRLQPLAEQRGFIYLHPDGTMGQDGRRFWNATDACCDMYNTGVDDSGYIEGLINEAKQDFNIDPKRVFLVGHSNGGFMSYRMACDHADSIAAIASLAGAMYEDPTRCKPSQPVSVLEIHGTADTTVPYAGGTLGSASFPGAQQTVQDWATLDGCSATPTTVGTEDFSTTQAGAETTVTHYTGCKPGGAAELWTMQGEVHIPAINDNFRKSVIDFLFAHPKP